MRFLPRRPRRGDRPRPAPSRQKAQQWYVAGARPDLLAGPNGPDGDVEYFYQAGHLLVRDEYAPRVREMLEAIGKSTDRRPVLPRTSVAGVQLIRLGGDEKTLSTIDTLRLLVHGRVGKDVELPRGLAPTGGGVVSLNHAVTITGEAGHCPANEPEPVPPGTPRRPSPTRDGFAGTGVRVVVVDTALDKATRDNTPWLKGVVGVDDPAGAGATAADDRYRGHGTFIAGLVRTVAPGAEVVVRALFQHRGLALETELVSALHAVLEEDQPDIINLSSGTYTFEHTGLLALEAFHQNRLRHHKGVVLVTAAGNDHVRDAFWPAAAPFAVSAGALNKHADGRADFSNLGGWVDVYAPGTDLVNAYPSGYYTYQEPPWDAVPRTEYFSGLARWSGTSFATPLVSGLIAARMSHTGENGRTAAAALVRDAQRGALPGVGAVLMPR